MVSNFVDLTSSFSISTLLFLDLEQKHVETRSVKYPENLTALNAIRFTWMPSYCYYVNIEWDKSFSTFELLIAVGKLLAGLEAMLNVIDHIIIPNMVDLYQDAGVFRYDSRGHFLDTLAHVTLLAVSTVFKAVQAYVTI